MVLEHLREIIAEQNEEAVLFDRPSFDKSIIGISQDGRVIYDFDKMIEEFMVEEELDYMGAIEFLEYNTLRSLNYWTMEYKPIVMTRVGLI